jgi:hypothetical protein
MKGKYSILRVFDGSLGLLLYLDVLKKQGKYDVGIELVDDKLKYCCKVEFDRLTILNEWLILDGQFGRVVELSKEILLVNPDDWVTHLSMLKALSALDAEERHVNQELQFYQEIQEKALGYKNVLRGPFLGELYYRKEFGYTESTTLLLEYIKRFGFLSCCFDDIFPLLDLVETGEIEALLGDLDDMLDKDLKAENMVFPG